MTGSGQGSGTQDELKVVTTGDGSSTLFVPQLNEHYHSSHGAIRESMHIFIEAGFRSIPSYVEKLNILEIGFGTGLNALLTAIECVNNTFSVNYIGIDTQPLGMEFTSRLNYAELIEAEEAKDLYQEISSAEWDNALEILPSFILTKKVDSLLTVALEPNWFNLVYFDAFSPEVQPEMWTEANFMKIACSLVRGGVFVTYCCKGQVKRDLKAAGFVVQKLPGPPGKREFIRAVKI